MFHLFGVLVPVSPEFPFSFVDFSTGNLPQTDVLSVTVNDVNAEELGTLTAQKQNLHKNDVENT